MPPTSHKVNLENTLKTFLVYGGILPGSVSVNYIAKTRFNPFLQFWYFVFPCPLQIVLTGSASAVFLGKFQKITYRLIFSSSAKMYFIHSLKLAGGFGGCVVCCIFFLLLLFALGFAFANIKITFCPIGIFKSLLTIKERLSFFFCLESPRLFSYNQLASLHRGKSTSPLLMIPD